MANKLRASSIMAAVGLAAGLATLPATAATCTSGDVTFTFDPASASSCSTGQPDYSGPEPIVQSFFDMDYILSSKSDEGGKGTGLVDFQIGNGTWALGDVGDFDSLVIGFSQAGHYGAFLLDDPILVDGLTGTWGILGPSTSTNVYSHLDVWYKPGGVNGGGNGGGNGGEPNVIPLPASLPLLFGALAGIGFISRKRKST